MAGSQKRRRKVSRKKGRRAHSPGHCAAIVFCIITFCASAWLWKAALSGDVLERQETQVSAEDYRPQVGDPPYRVVVDAGHGGTDPGARGVVEEKNMTAATASALVEWLDRDPNFIPLQTRTSYEDTATPAQRAAAANAQTPQLLLSIHGNSAANGSTAAGFECYPAVPGRTWHQESFYFAQQLASGMCAAGAHLRGQGGIRYIYYLENDQKQLVESTYAGIRAERSFTLLEDVNCPAVLAEQCFVTSEEDVAQFGSEEGCKKVARIYYEAICRYFGTDPLPQK